MSGKTNEISYLRSLFTEDLKDRRARMASSPKNKRSFPGRGISAAIAFGIVAACSGTPPETQTAPTEDVSDNNKKPQPSYACGGEALDQRYEKAEDGEIIVGLANSGQVPCALPGETALDPKVQAQILEDEMLLAARAEVGMYAPDVQNVQIEVSQKAGQILVSVTIPQDGNIWKNVGGALKTTNLTADLQRKYLLSVIDGIDEAEADGEFATKAKLVYPKDVITVYADGEFEVVSGKDGRDTRTAINPKAPVMMSSRGSGVPITSSYNNNGGSIMASINRTADAAGN